MAEARIVTRRDFCGTAAAAAAAFATASVPLGAIAQGAGAGSGIRPFEVSFAEAELADLRRRITATRWPERETVADDSQGVPLSMIQTLSSYWATGYDWRKCEARLNGLPQFTTEIDGLNLYFIHVRSPHDDAMPLVMTHGWPGSVLEFMRVIGPLTNPTAHGGKASDAFHLVIPSMPGYGFSEKPAASGWNLDRIARAWVALMKQLGYRRFAAQGGDWGSGVCEVMALQAQPELLGIHVNLPATVPPDIAKSLAAGSPPPADLSAEEKTAYEQLAALFAKRRAYAGLMGTRPQTLYGVADSPVGLASWLLDHGDGYGQPAAALVSAVMGRAIDGHSAGDLTLDDVLDDITLYWLTNTGVSSGRLYWENTFNLYNAANVGTPTAVSVFPGENYQAPRSWAERAYHNLIYYNRADKGGHFAAWEQSEIFVGEVRAGLQPLRNVS
jgi:pimeloyl-ACP methyl ester carboxylesterase